MELCGSSRSVILEKTSRPAVAAVLQNDDMKDGVPIGEPRTSKSVLQKGMALGG